MTNVVANESTKRWQRNAANLANSFVTTRFQELHTNFTQRAFQLLECVWPTRSLICFCASILCDRSSGFERDGKVHSRVPKKVHSRVHFGKQIVNRAPSLI